MVRSIGAASMRTASNIAAHALAFRVATVFDLLTVAGVVVLNVALYELLAPVHWSLARLAAFWRLGESTVYGAIVVFNFVVLSVLSGADYLQAFEPGQLQALARLFIGARNSGFWIAILSLLLGSTTYCYLLVKSHYVPRVLALFGVTGLRWACSTSSPASCSRRWSPRPSRASSRCRLLRWRCSR